LTDTAASEESAERLAAVLREYWFKRGFVVTTRIEYVHGKHTKDKRTERVEGHWAIHSDLRNGFPTKRVMEVAA
jgi:hypothetical protein